MRRRASVTTTGLEADDLEPRELYARLSRLVTETHLRQPAYKPSRLVYPWVDLHPDRELRGIYSGKTFDPEEFIREDFAMEQAASRTSARTRPEREPASARKPARGGGCPRSGISLQLRARRPAVLV